MLAQPGVDCWCLWVLGVEFEDSFKAYFGVLNLVQALEYDAQVEISLDMVRFQFEGFPIVLDCFFELAQAGK